MSSPLRIVIWISGRGSNMQAIIDKPNRPYEVVAVVSNNPEAAGLSFARDRGLPVEVINRKNFASLAQAKNALLDAIAPYSPDLVALAGFMWVLPPTVVNALRGKLINIHPSLLPKYPGLDTHQRAIEANETQHGCSVHFVSEEVDGGPIISQACVPVLSNDTTESLSQRVLEAEHRLYPWVVEMIATGQIQYDDGIVSYSTGARTAANAMGFSIPYS